MKLFIPFGIIGMLLLFSVTFAEAATDCTFTMSGNTMTLDGDCQTDSTIGIPDGFTLDGDGYTITAVDPPAGHFIGAVIVNNGITAYVEHLTVTADSLSNVCDVGADRLRGIMFEGASGHIKHCTVQGINQGLSGCQEGNAIEIRNAPFDGEHPDTKTVEISHNFVDDYQKTGIVANGDVVVAVHHNHIGDSATQNNLAANSVQIGFGGTGSIDHNIIYGNQWLGTSDWAATAILLYLADNVIASQNNIRGNSDVGLYICGDNGIFDNNKIFDEGIDGPNGDYGLINFGTSNLVTNNKVKGFDEPYYDVTSGKNKVIPGPQNENVFW